MTLLVWLHNIFVGNEVIILLKIIKWFRLYSKNFISMFIHLNGALFLRTRLEHVYDLVNRQIVDDHET